MPELHTAVFQLGEDKTSLYQWTGEKLEPIKLEDVNVLMKQPKPNVNVIDIAKFEKYLESKAEDMVTDFPTTTSFIHAFLNYIQSFLENKPKNADN